MPEVSLNQLQPNTTYSVQLRSTGRNTGSEWSPVFTFTTGSDPSAPEAPSNLTIKYAGGSMILNWNAPTLNEDGTPLQDLKWYEIEATNGSTTVKYTILGTTFDFDAIINAAAFSGFKSPVNFAVYSVDTSGNRSSTPATITGTKALPSAPTGLVFTASESDFVARWTAPSGDVKDYQVTISDGTTSRPYYSTSTSWTFTREENVSFFGSFKPNLTVTVKTRDSADQLSATGVTASAGNAIPKAPTGLSWTAQGDSFEATWSTVVQNVDNTPLTDLRGYEVTVIFDPTSQTPSVRKFDAPGNSFSFPYALNEKSFAGQARSPLTIEVRAKDSVGQLSAAATAVATNTSPNAPQGLSGTEQYNGIALSWSAVTDSDLKRYEIFTSSSAGGTKSLLATSTDTSFLHQTVSFTTDHFYWVRAVDKFNQNSADSTPVGPLRPRNAIQVDNTAPAAVTGGLTFDPPPSLQANGAPQIFVAWTPVADTDNDMAGYKVRFSPISDPDDGVRVWSYSNDVAPDDITNGMVRTTITAGLHSGEPDPVTGTPPGQDYIVQVRAYDFSANYAGWISGTTTTPAGGTTSSDIADQVEVLPGGSIESSNYEPNVTGWRLTDSTLNIEGGTISSRALSIQEGSNLMPAEFAGFEFVPDYYTSDRMYRSIAVVSPVYTNPVTIISSGAKYQTQALQFVAHGDVFLGPGNTSSSVNVPIESGSDYILSYWARSISGSPTLTPKVVLSTGAATLSGGSNTIGGVWTRYSRVFTAGASDVSALIGFTGAGSSGATPLFIQIDGVQVERKISSSTLPSPWKPPGLTRIDGGIIRTGEIRSTTNSPVGDTTQPAWSLNMQGNMQINDGLVRGRLLVGGGNNTNVAISSANYGTAGQSQWSIKGDGTFEIRGAAAGNKAVVLDSAGLRGYNGSVLTVDLNTSTGNFAFASSNGAIRFDGDSLKLYSGVTPTVSLNSDGTAMFTGQVTAQSGSIGGWSIASTGISAGSLSIRSDIGQIFSGSAGTTVGMRAGYGFWAGAENHWDNPPFSVSTGGYLYSRSGQIGGFYLNGDSGLYAGSGATRVHMQPNAGFWAGADAQGNAPFYVTQAGYLRASNANITGTITATSGSFSGTVYASGGSFSGNVYGSIFYSRMNVTGTRQWIEIGSSGSGDYVDEIRLYANGYASSIRNSSSYPGGIVLSTSNGGGVRLVGELYTQGNSIQTSGGWLYLQGGSLSTTGNVNAGAGTFTGQVSSQGLYAGSGTVSTSGAGVFSGGINAGNYWNNAGTQYMRPSSLDRIEFGDSSGTNYFLDNGTTPTGGIKNFVVEHPSEDKAGKNFLVHACLEGPTADVYYRGMGRLHPEVARADSGDRKLDRAEITLPDYFEDLTEVEGRTVQVTPICGICDECGLFVAPSLGASIVRDGKFKVYALAGYGHGCAKFYWEVKAIRKGAQFEVEPAKSKYELHGDGPYTYLTPKPNTKKKGG